MTVCFNTIAVVFMCEIDNVAFEVGLAERIRARVEDAARVELSESELKALARSKVVHVIVIVFSCVMCVYLCGQSLEAFRNSDWDNTKEEPKPGALMSIGLASIIVAYWVAGVADAIMGELSGVDLAKQIAWVTAMRFASLICGGPFVMYSFFGRSDSSIDDDDISSTLAAFAARGMLNNTGLG